ncbi:MAG: DUF1573 domain-containing protein [Bernardetiaceae bacterium]|jgi:hypothetical protein|nr:DUF1573 domain-containing protein [Bernardetiaceae bacterium]
MKKLVMIGWALAAMGLLACDKQTGSSETATATDKPANVVATSNQTGSANETPAEATDETLAEFQFDQIDHDFGTIPEGQVVKHVYKFKNVGKVPLVVSNVQPQCGCTATSWTKTPVPPGSTGEIEVQFDSNGRAGQNNKSTTVTANVKDGSKLLYFTVNVSPKPAGGPPLRQ